MATQTGTLILRPTASKGSVYLTVPADTPVEDCWKLVNEEEADNNATYVTAISTATNVTYFLFSIPEKIKIIDFSSAQFYYICSGDYDENVRIGYCDYLNETVFDDVYHSGGNEEWLSHHMSINDDGIEAIKNNNFGAFFGVFTADTSKAYTNHITQFYVSIPNCTYEIADSSIYFKESDEWVSLTGSIYYKESGVWIKTDASALTNGNYTLKSV